MPYPYYTQSYTPNYQQYYQPAFQPNYQPVQVPQPQTQAPMQNQSGIIWISGQNEALAYPVAPNNAVTLWSQTEPVVYLKQADATGKPTLKIYDLVERAQTASNAAPASDGKTVEYATKSDLSAVVGVVKGFDELLGTLKSDIDTIKGDMYGIAGKKKAGRKPKTEETEDDE